MECRKIVITLVSANSLPDVRNFGQMKVYATVSIKGESETSKRTPPDMEGKTNPIWNFPIEYTVSDSTVHKPGINLVIKLYCRRTLKLDKYIGEVNIPIKSLFDKGVKADKVLSYMVCGTSKGRLNILYSFGEKKALQVGFMVLLGGVIYLLGGDDDDVQALPASSNVRIVEYNDDDDDDDEDIFYDPE